MSASTTPAAPTTIPVEIRDRWAGKLLFTAQVDVSIGVTLRLKAAVEIAARGGADLRDANLGGADLRDADLGGAIGISVPTPEEAEARIRAVAQAALASDEALHMSDWHRCETSHCIAGWAIHLAGYAGYALEKAVGAPMAGLMLLGTDAHAHFYDDDATARAWLQSKLTPTPPQPTTDEAA